MAVAVVSEGLVLSMIDGGLKDLANKDHLAIIKQGVSVWNEWRTKYPYIRPDLRDIDLRRADLSEAILDNADLSFAKLRSATFRHANLNGAILKYADLTCAILSPASLRGAILSDADLSGANLSHSTLKGVTLSRAKLTRAILFVADLSDASLLDVDLHDADLRRAKLTRAKLAHADLRGSDLSRAVFNGADLSGAMLGNANLSNADLTNADLSGTDLGSTNLSCTDFSDSLLLGTIFADNNLSEVVGLNTVRHKGPSSIGIDTFYKSKGNIPEIFLRGCGVPEIFITYAHSLVEKAFDFYSCFISYSTVEKPFARRLHDALQGRGIRCWLDEKQLLPGDDIYDQVDQGIRLWDKVLLCCSKDSLSSWWVDKEIATAFDKEQKLWKERGEKVLALIPLNLDGYMFSDDWKGGKGIPIKSRLAADFTGWETDYKKFEEQFEQVVKALRTDGGRETAPVAKL